MYVGRGAIGDDLCNFLRYVFKLCIGGANVVPAIDNEEGCALFRAANKAGYFVHDSPHLFPFISSSNSGNVGKSLQRR